LAQIPLGGSIGVPGSVPILGSYNVIFTSDSDHTLSSTEWSNQFLQVTSSISLTSTRELICPIVLGMCFIVQNKTTGGQSITIIGSSGTGITVSNGNTSSVVCDGTNYLLNSGGGAGSTIGSGPLASLPSSPSTGNLYLPTDAPQAYEYNGTSWQTWGPLYPIILPVSSQAFALVNDGTNSPGVGATLTYNNGGMTIFSPTNSGSVQPMGVIANTNITSGYAECSGTFTGAGSVVANTEVGWGPCLYNSSAKKYVAFISATKISTSSSTNAYENLFVYVGNAVSGQFYGIPSNGCQFLRIAISGSNIAFLISRDRVSWIQTGTASLSTGLGTGLSSSTFYTGCFGGVIGGPPSAFDTYATFFHYIQG
jgi:hypothetical protein